MSTPTIVILIATIICGFLAYTLVSVKTKGKE